MARQAATPDDRESYDSYPLQTTLASDTRHVIDAPGRRFNREPRSCLPAVIHPVDPAKMNELLSLMTSDEIRDGLWFVCVCERNGNIEQADVDEWRRRMRARQGCLHLDGAANSN